MGGGGEAPPVKGEDVIILIGASILLVTLILHAWVTPTKLHTTNGDDGEEKLDQFIVSHDMSPGDIFEVEVLSGSVMIEIKNDFENYVVADNSNSDKWEFEAEIEGQYFFKITDINDGNQPDHGSEFVSSISRGLILDLILYPVGLTILGFGIVKRYYPSSEDGDLSENVESSNEKVIEALLED